MTRPNAVPANIESVRFITLILRPRPRSTDLGHVQLRRAVGLDVGQHPDLHAGSQPDPGRDELEAGGVYGVSGELHCAGSDAAEFASRSAVWNSVSGAGAGFFRSAGGQRGGGFAGAGGVRMVWHPDLDWRRGDQCVAGDGVAGMEVGAAWRGHLLSWRSGSSIWR